MSSSYELYAVAKEVEGYADEMGYSSYLERSREGYGLFEDSGLKRTVDEALDFAKDLHTGAVDGLETLATEIRRQAGIAWQAEQDATRRRTDQAERDSR